MMEQHDLHCPFLSAGPTAATPPHCVAKGIALPVGARYAASYCTTAQHAGCRLFTSAGLTTAQATSTYQDTAPHLERLGEELRRTNPPVAVTPSSRRRTVPLWAWGLLASCALVISVGIGLGLQRGWSLPGGGGRPDGYRYW